MWGRVARVNIVGQGGQGVHCGAGWPGCTLRGRVAWDRTSHTAGQGGQGVHCGAGWPGIEPVTLRGRVDRVYIAGQGGLG